MIAFFCVCVCRYVSVYRYVHMSAGAHIGKKTAVPAAAGIIDNNCQSPDVVIGN